MTWLDHDERLYEKVAAVLVEFDPEALIATGLSEEVYSLVAYRISKALSRLGRMPTLEGLAHILSLSLFISFGDWTQSVTCLEVHRIAAQKLSEALAKPLHQHA